MRTPCNNCPDKKEDYECAGNCKKRLAYVQSEHEPWMATKSMPVTDDTNDLDSDELQGIVEQLRFFPSVYPLYPRGKQ